MGEVRDEGKGRDSVVGEVEDVDGRKDWRLGIRRCNGINLVGAEGKDTETREVRQRFERGKASEGVVGKGESGQIGCW